MRPRQRQSTRNAAATQYSSAREGRAEEATGSTSSAWKPKISALAPRAGKQFDCRCGRQKRRLITRLRSGRRGRSAALPQHSSPRARPSGGGDTTPFPNRETQDFGARVGRRGHSWCSSDPTARSEARECRGVERRRRASYCIAVRSRTMSMLSIPSDRSI